jgi:hypothetical protein
MLYICSNISTCTRIHSQHAYWCMFILAFLYALYITSQYALKCIIIPTSCAICDCPIGYVIIVATKIASITFVIFISLFYLWLSSNITGFLRPFVLSLWSLCMIAHFSEHFPTKTHLVILFSIQNILLTLNFNICLLLWINLVDT